MLGCQILQSRLFPPHLGRLQGKSSGLGHILEVDGILYSTGEGAPGGRRLGLGLVRLPGEVRVPDDGHNLHHRQPVM